MPTTLDAILAGVRGDLAARKAVVPFRIVAEAAGRNPNRRSLRLGPGDGPGIIAEIKRASPSRGWIARDLDAGRTAARYVRGGACAVSVLTEERCFKGSLRDLGDASAASGGVPVLRKDFVIDEYMLAESRAWGADLVLLIVAVLGDDTRRMVRLAKSHGLDPLVEVHDEAEMAVARDSGARLIGINTRNLKTLKVDLSVAKRLLPLAPSGATAIVESGIRTAEDVCRFAAQGARAFLVGESIVASGEPEEKIAALASR